MAVTRYVLFPNLKFLLALFLGRKISGSLCGSVLRNSLTSWELWFNEIQEAELQGLFSTHGAVQGQQLTRCWRQWPWIRTTTTSWVLAGDQSPSLGRMTDSREPSSQWLTKGSRFKGKEKSVQVNQRTSSMFRLIFEALWNQICRPPWLAGPTVWPCHLLRACKASWMALRTLRRGGAEAWPGCLLLKAIWF